MWLHKELAILVWKKHILVKKIQIHIIRITFHEHFPLYHNCRYRIVYPGFQGNPNQNKFKFLGMLQLSMYCMKKYNGLKTSDTTHSNHGMNIEPKRLVTFSY